MWICGNYQLDAYPVRDKISLTTFLFQMWIQNTGRSGQSKRENTKNSLTFALYEI